MLSIMIVGDDAPLVPIQAGLLDEAGHRVELPGSLFRARERLSGEACDIVVIDVRSPDCGLGLLIEQARAAWPDCAVLALVKRPDLRRTKVHQMGLWTPDMVLVHPVLDEDLVSAVRELGARRSAGTGREGAVL